MNRYLGSFAAICVSVGWVAGNPANADDTAALVDQHVASGEFGPATRAVEQLPPKVQLPLKQKIAAAQRQAGAMQSTAQLSPASNFALNNGAQPAMPHHGGGPRADFDTLMELIQETISPDSWEEAGGPGRMSPFPLGVHVDAAGLLRRMAPAKSTDTSLITSRIAALHSREGRDVRASSALRKISLTRLESELQNRLAVGLGPDATMQHLAGLRRVQYVFVYPETGEIVIAGPAGDWAYDADSRAVAVEPPGDDGTTKVTRTPVLYLDDLLVLLRQAQGGKPFTCTIEPTKEGLAAAQDYLVTTRKKPLKEGKAARDAWVTGLRNALGKQNIKVAGIDARTHVARTIVEADYHMKRIGMGLEPGAGGVVSYLDSIDLRDGEAPPAMDVLRWWFTLAETPPSTTEQRNAFSLHAGSVRVLSENEFLKTTGEVVYTGKTTERNLRFANSFTRNFDALATKYPVYADLRNVFDLAMVAALIENEKLDDQVGWQMGLFLDGQQLPVTLGTAPAQVESICNSRLINGKYIIAGVSGGVDVDTSKLLGKKVKIDTYGVLKASHGESVPKKVSPDGWWWD